MLTNAAARAARPSARPYKMADAGGLYLLVRPSGRKTLRCKYRYAGREQLLTIGDFPDIGLADARARRDEAHAQLRRGVDPSAAAARARAAEDAAELARQTAMTFEAAARRWHAHRRASWSDVHAADVLASLERDAFPAIGARALASIDAPAVLRVLRAVEARGSVETARRLRQRISDVFALAISEGSATQDPAAILVRALVAPPAKRRQPALVDLDEARALLAATDVVDAVPVTKLASRFLALTAVRLAAVRGARWDELEDVDVVGGFVGPQRPIWRVPAARMKLTKVRKTDPAAAHLVPLSAAAVDVLRAAHHLVGGNELIFPGRSGSEPIGEAAIGALYARAGYGGRHVPHGWRATFSTILNERWRADRDAIDMALAHVPKGMDRTEAAYNRAEHLALRRLLFQRWADLLYS